MIGERPRHEGRKVCYHLLVDDPNDPAKSSYKEHEWFVGGYIEYPEDKDVHPFGAHWILVPWVIEGDTDSRIDDFEEEYERVIVTLKEF